MTARMPPAGAKPFELDRLVETSPWPARLLGLEPWQTKPRTVDHNLREYDREKYASLRQWLGSVPETQRTPFAAQAHMEAAWVSGPRVISFANRLYEVERESWDAYREQLYADTLVPIAERGADAIVELGCAFGYQLASLRRLTKLPLAGGELSPTAVMIANDLFRPEDRIQVVELDFNDPEGYARALRACGGKRVTIFTSHAVSMLPSAKPLLDNLRLHRDRIERVVHLEPVTGLFDSRTLLGQLRRSYARANDYNCDLLELLEAAEDIVIEERESDVLGVNPLTPLNLLAWRFA